MLKKYILQFFKTVRLDRGVLQREHPDRSPDLQEHLHPQLGDLARQRKRPQTEERFLQKIVFLIFSQRFSNKGRRSEDDSFRLESANQGDELHHHQQLQQQHHRRREKRCEEERKE